MDSIEISFGENIGREEAEKYLHLVVEKIGDRVERISDLEQHGNFGFYIDVYDEDELDDIEDEILSCFPESLAVGTRQTYF